MSLKLRRCNTVMHVMELYVEDYIDVKTDGKALRVFNESL
jgi:hypothetical protein